MRRCSKFRSSGATSGAYGAVVPRQSLAENAVSRFKSLLGTTVAARKFDNQRAEAIVKCGALNRMTSLGMPDSGRI